jgi:hypothetical protein
MPQRSFESPPERTGLTPDQKRDALAAIYGVPSQGKNMAIQTDSRHKLSPEEILSLRTLLAKQDDDPKPVKEFDLNKPPQQPYTHQDFPRAVYHHLKAKVKSVADQAELDKHLAAGWTIEPFPQPQDDPDIPLSGAEQQEVAKLDAEARKPKAKS